MIQIDFEKNCCGCHACYNICPKNAIAMVEDEKGFKYPRTDIEKCINCGLCEKVCPVLKNNEINNQPKVFACINKNDKIRKESSSGGMFSLIAENILQYNGVVFGAMLNDKFEVVHSYVENINDLYKFRGSKYVQSIIGDCYKKSKEILENGRYVLFTGTPCQIEGLKSYLQKDYDKLYTQDIICHGVPSPKVWKKYIDFRKSIDRKKINKIEFRNKDAGWKNYNIKFNYKENSYIKEAKKDVYIQSFLNNLCLRDSCYNCKFKKENRNSDITLADFWGIQNVLPKMDDDRGTSLVIVNSRKGEELFESVKENIKYIEVNFNEAIRYNKSMISSVKLPKNRELFFNNLENLKFNKLVKKYSPKVNIFKLIINKVKSMLKRIIKR